MGDPLKNLEERLERLVPQGLSDSGRTRLEDQIDELASAVEQKASGRETQKLVAVAAGLAILAAAGVFVGMGLAGDRDATLADERVEPVPAEDPFDSAIEPVDFLRVVAQIPSDGGYVQGDENRPFRTWIYPVREEETVRDKETNYEIVIVSEHEEKILTPVTRF